MQNIGQIYCTVKKNYNEKRELLKNIGSRRIIKYYLELWNELK